MNNLKTLIVGMIAILATIATTAYAHHSTRGIYQEDVELELTGKVTEWKFINPHPSLRMEVTDENGDVHEWDVSYGGAAVVHLQRQGYTADTFKPGDVVIIKGNPTRKAGVYGLLVEGGAQPTREDGTPVVEGGSMF